MTGHVVWPGHRCDESKQALAAACRDREASAHAELEAVLTATVRSARRRRAAAAALLRARVASEHIDVGVVMRPPATASGHDVRRHARIGRRVAMLVAAHAALYAVFLTLWAVVGAAALDTRPGAATLATVAALLTLLVVLRALATSTAGGVAVAAGALLKRRLFAGALALPVDRTRTQGAGRLLGRVLECEAVETLALSGGYLTFLAIVEVLAASWVLHAGVHGALLLTALALWMSATVALAGAYLQRRRRWSALRLDMTHDLVERLVGHRTTLAQATRGRGCDGNPLTRYGALARRMDRVAAVLTAGVPRGWTVVGIAALLLVHDGGSDAGRLAVSIGGVLLATAGLEKLGRGLAQLSDAAVAWQRVAYLAAATATDPGPDPAERAHEGEALLEVDAVSYRHDGRRHDVLAGASLRINPGDRMVLDGPSGAGKSTLAAIMAGLRQESGGTVRVRGCTSLEARRQRVVVAPQIDDNHLFCASLAFNVLLGRTWPPSAADLAEAEAVCRELGLGGLIDAMPAGMAQMIGETGWQLSHGERGRVFAARALLQRADVVVLDESFAALDPVTLRQLLRSVQRRAEALLVIAHDEVTTP